MSFSNLILWVYFLKYCQRGNWFFYFLILNNRMLLIRLKKRLKIVDKSFIYAIDLPALLFHDCYHHILLLPSLRNWIIHHNRLILGNILVQSWVICLELDFRTLVNGNSSSSLQLYFLNLLVGWEIRLKNNLMFRNNLWHFVSMLLSLCISRFKMSFLQIYLNLFNG